MSLSYYDASNTRKQAFRLAKAFMLLNGAMAVAMAFYWSGLAGFIGEPFKWAMRDNVSPAPSLFEYPFLTLWITPLLCMCGGWLALKAHHSALARIIGAYPTLMLSLMVGWYYLTPTHWH